MSCQQCSGIEQVFDDASIRKQLRRFRRRGPDKTTRMLIDDLRRILAGEAGSPATLLDVGAGLGAIHHELLNDVVAQAVHVEASPAQMAAAREETLRRGHERAVEFLSGDFTALAERLSSADVVTLDRVICCFDDMERLVQLSADKARRFYGAVFPRDLWWMRIAMGVINLVQQLKRSPFRVFLHSPRDIDATLRSSGLRKRSERHTVGWHVVVYERLVAA